MPRLSDMFTQQLRKNNGEEATYLDLFRIFIIEVKNFARHPVIYEKKLLVALLASICSTVIALNKCRENVAITEI